MFSCPRTINQLLETRVEFSSNSVALVSADVQLTYAELSGRVERFAFQLKRLGIERGDRIGIHLHKSAEEVIATFAAASIGAVFVNINYQWTGTQLRHVVRDCGISVLVTDQRKGASFKDLCDNGEIGSIVVTASADAGGGFNARESAREASNSRWRQYQPVSTDLAALLYTSGSTGSPKGVMVTHANVVSGARVVSDYLGLNREDRILSVPPLNFDYGLNQLMAAVWVGGTLVLPRAALPSEILGTVENQGVTVLPLVAPSWVQVLKFLVEQPMLLSSLRLATNTGGKIPLSLLERIEFLLPNVSFVLMYGLTEAFRSTYVPPNLFREKLGAIGIAVPDNEVFVIDPDRGLCNPDEIGELVHRGSFVSRGYWGKPELSAERIKPNPHLYELIGHEPVVHSGDLVRRDDDGFLWFVGRRDDMIKSSGFRMSPNEVEDIACSADGVIEAVAWGIEDDEFGQLVYLAVHVDNSDIDEASLAKSYRKSMPAYMVPRRIFLLDQSMPRTANGKLDRQAIIAQCSIER